MLGKTVLFGLTPDQASTQNQSKVLPAIVVCDFGDGLVNLRVFGDVGNSFSATSVPKDTDPKDGDPGEYKWVELGD